MISRMLSGLTAPRFLPVWISLAILSACGRDPEPPAPPRPALVVTAGAAVPETMGLVGEVRPRHESAQGFRIAGKIVERRVEVGASVRKGQVLARLDAADAHLAAQASQADVRAAEADQALAQAELERQRQLFASGFISRSALDLRESQFKAAAARTQQARARASVSDNQTRYSDLVADRDGVVTEIQAEPGQVVEIGQLIARIAAPGELEVVLALPESRMAGIKPGAVAEVRLWASREKAYAARVREVAPAADTATRTFLVRVSVPEADAAMRMGMTAGVRFSANGSDALRLPLSALGQRDARPVVWVVDANNRVQPRPVRTGSYSEHGVTILEGLHADERVVAVGIQALTPGQTVRPVPQGTAQEGAR